MDWGAARYRSLIFDEEFVEEPEAGFYQEAPPVVLHVWGVCRRKRQDLPLKTSCKALRSDFSAGLLSLHGVVWRGEALKSSFFPQGGIRAPVLHGVRNDETGGRRWS